MYAVNYTLKKRQIQNLTAAAIALVVIGTIAGYAYSMEQTRQAGFAFGNELFEIQELAGQMQSEFNSHITQWKDGEITASEFEEFATGHFRKMEEAVLRYDLLSPPSQFESSVHSFRLSLESQLDSDREYLLWVTTGDNSHLVRSDLLIQEAFEYETAALGQFNRAKAGIAEPDT